MSNRTMPHYELNKDRNRDNKLIQEYKNTGEGKYMGELYRRYKGKVFGKCSSMLCNEEEARDAVHDIFIKVLAKIGTFSEESSFSTRLYSITYNHCIDILRRRGKTIQIIDNITTTYESPEGPEEMCDAEKLDQEIEKMRMVLGKLQDDDKYILLLKYQADKSIKEIAGLLGEKTESAVKMQIMRAKQRAQSIAGTLLQE